MSKWDGLDRRRFPRVRFPCLVVIRSQTGEPKQVLLTHTENLGSGGMCVILKEDLCMFTPVEVELDLLDLSEHIQCKGRVVWNVQRKSSMKQKPFFYDIGIEFQGLSEKGHGRLEHVVNQLVKSNK